MSTKNLKSKIKWNKIHMRSLKTTYKGLSPSQKKIIKLCEKREGALKGLDYFWRKICVYKKNAGGYKICDNARTDWTVFHLEDKKWESACRSLNKYSEEEIEKAENLFKLLNQGRLLSSSF